jgi:hypothetical protein
VGLRNFLSGLKRILIITLGTFFFIGIIGWLSYFFDQKETNIVRCAFNLYKNEHANGQFLQFYNAYNGRVWDRISCEGSSSGNFQFFCDCWPALPDNPGCYIGREVFIVFGEEIKKAISIVQIF